MEGICSECGGIYFQHDTRCPNNPYPEYAFNCPECDEKLYEDNVWYPVLKVCEYCIGDFKKQVEKPDPRESNPNYERDTYDEI